MKSYLPRLFICLFFVSTSLWAQVAYHLEKNHQWVPYEINGMKKVHYIYTVGDKYAWAEEDNSGRISFFNGKEWSNTDYILDMTKNVGIYPAYPLTGKSSAAWAIGINALGESKVAFFDGKNWKPVVINELNQAAKLNMYVSGGIAWFQFTDANFNKSLKVTDVNNPDIIKTIPLEQNNWPWFANSIASEEPILYTKKNDNFNSAYFKMDFEGNSTLWFEEPKYTSNFRSLIYRDNKYIVLKTDNNIYYSIDDGKNFNTVTNHSVDLSFNTFYEGLICGLSYDYEQRQDYIGCVDTKENLPIWHNTPLPKYVAPIISYTVKDGAWIVGASDSSPVPSNLVKPYIFWYDYKNDKLSDTDVSKVANTIEASASAPYLRIINNHEIVAYGKNKQQQYSAFYYDGKKWYTQAIPGITYGQFSMTGTYTNPPAASNNTNIWIANSFQDDLSEAANSLVKKKKSDRKN